MKPSYKITFAVLLVWAGWLGGAATASAEVVAVAVAANFSEPMKTLAPAFEQSTGHTVQVSAASTGALYAQIKNGAPFDVLLSADTATPERLEKEQLAVTGSRFTYATGKLALWSATAGVVDELGDVLHKGQFAHLAIANPATAPYGAAAMEVLKKKDVLSAVQPKLVQGENITQTFQFVSTGNAELGFVALSQVFFEGKIKAGSAWVVPAALYTPLRQDAVLLNRGKDKSAAQALLVFLKSDAAKKIMRSYGYE